MKTAARTRIELADRRGWPLAAPAYSKKKMEEGVFLTHAVDFDAEVVICRRAKFSNVLADELSPALTETPTCTECRRRLGL